MFEPGSFSAASRLTNLAYKVCRYMRAVCVVPEYVCVHAYTCVGVGVGVHVCVLLHNVFASEH